MAILKSKFFYLGLFIFFILLFVVQNARPVEINFLFWNLIEINFFFVLFVFYALGFLTSFMIKTRKPKKTTTTSFESDSAI